MNKIVEKDLKINKTFDDNNKIVMMLSKHKATKGLLINIKTKRKTMMAKKMLTSGAVSMNQYTEYLKKISKEKELLRKESKDFTEILFETDDCTLCAEFIGGSLKYSINQYGMKNYYEELTVAIERFAMISM